MFTKLEGLPVKSGTKTADQIEMVISIVFSALAALANRPIGSETLLLRYKFNVGDLRRTETLSEARYMEKGPDKTVPLDVKADIVAKYVVQARYADETALVDGSLEKQDIYFDGKKTDIDMKSKVAKELIDMCDKSVDPPGSIHVTRADRIPATKRVMTVPVKALSKGDYWRSIYSDPTFGVGPAECQLMEIIHTAGKTFAKIRVTAFADKIEWYAGSDAKHMASPETIDAANHMQMDLIFDVEKGFFVSGEGHGTASYVRHEKKDGKELTYFGTGTIESKFKLLP